MKFRKIGILTSGGDAPGMNASIRAITREALENGIEVVGIMGGYKGLIDEDLTELDARKVSNIINLGGTNSKRPKVWQRLLKPAARTI